MRHRVLGRCLHRCRKREHVVASTAGDSGRAVVRAIASLDLRDGWTAFRERTGLVEGYDPHISKCVKPLAPFTRTPSCASRVRLLTTVTGMLITSAHGQATISSASPR